MDANEAQKLDGRILHIKVIDVDIGALGDFRIIFEILELGETFATNYLEAQ